MLNHLIWRDDLLAAETTFETLFGIWKHQLSNYVYEKSVTDCKQKAGIVKEGLQQHSWQWMKKTFTQPQSGGENLLFYLQCLNLSEGTSGECS